MTEAVWAYNITHKTTTFHPPFELIYETKAVLPLEIKLLALRITLEQQLFANEKMKAQLMQLDRLEETRQQSLHLVEINQNRQKAQLDAKIRKGWEQYFNEGDLVLCFDTRPNHQLDSKFLPTWLGPYKVIKERNNG